MSRFKCSCGLEFKILKELSKHMIETEHEDIYQMLLSEYDRRMPKQEMLRHLKRRKSHTNELSGGDKHG